MSILADFSSTSVITHTVNDFVVQQRFLDGYINATALSKAYKLATGKRRDVSEWLTNKRTIQSIEHLSSVTGIPVTDLVQVLQGGVEEQGTLIHPRLAVRFGIWLSDEFGYLVEQWVHQWALEQDQQTKVLTKKVVELEQKLDGALEAIATLQSQVLPDTSNAPPPGWDVETWASLPSQDKRHFRYLWRRRKFRPSNQSASEPLMLPVSIEEMKQKQRQEAAKIMGEPSEEEKQRLDTIRKDMLAKFWELGGKQ